MDFFFFEKKGGSCALLFYQKAAIEKESGACGGPFSKDGTLKNRRLRRALFKKILLGQSLHQVFGGPGAEPPEKFWGYDIKVLAFSFHFPMDKFAAQLTSPVAAWAASLAVFVGSTIFKRRRFTKLGRIWRHKNLQKPTLCAAKLSSVVDIFKEPFSKGGRPILKRRPYNFEKAVDPFWKGDHIIFKRRSTHFQKAAI